MSLFNIFGKKSVTDTIKADARKEVAKKKSIVKADTKKINYKKDNVTKTLNSKSTGESVKAPKKFREKCFECGGSGIVECDCTGGCGPEAANEDCYACGGKGYHTCPACCGAKWVYVD